MKKIFFRFLSVSLFSILFYSCVHDSLIKSTEVSFKNDVQLVLAGNCQTSGCHSSTNYSEFPLITYDDVMNFGEVVAGKPDHSKIYKSIKGNSNEMMPPAGPMSDAQIQIVYDWILQGAKNN